MTPDKFIEAFETGLRESGLTEAQVSVELSAHHPHLSGTRISLDRINVNPGERKSGIATQALTRLTQLSDASDVELYVIPHGLETGAMDDHALELWYEKFGFVTARDRETPRLMRRVPRARAIGTARIQK